MSPRPARSETRVGIVGLGFMGRTHLASYRAAHVAGWPNRIVAVADRNVRRLAGRELAQGNLPLDDSADHGDDVDLARHENAQDLFDRPDIDLVSLCTHTDTHVDLAIRALKAGKHVLVEKPIALRAEEIQRLERAELEAERFCMPAMCMRFWPGWDWLQQAVRRRTYGEVVRAEFQRRSGAPAWAPEFYGDPERSGGMLFDLHVHDADLVRWIFGAPRSVSCTGSLARLTTTYDLGPDGPLVSAEGAWDPAPEATFHMGFDVTFEAARARYDHGRESPLLLTRTGSAAEVPAYPNRGATGYDGEIRHALEACASGVRPEPTLREARELTAMLEAERRSLVSGQAVAL